MQTSTVKISFLIAFGYVCTGTLFSILYSFSHHHSPVLRFIFGLYSPISVPLELMFSDKGFPYIPLLIIDSCVLFVLWLFSAMLLRFFRDLANSKN